MQKLILPINNTRLTASWKTDTYRNRFGFTHYGIDMVSSKGNTLLYASGDGLVMSTGRDSVVGNVVAILYQNALNRLTGRNEDVIFRYFHLAQISVRAGQTVTKDTKIGYYGNTGLYGTGAHLHLEVDTDTLHPLWTPTVAASSFLKGSRLGANDLTMSNPVEWLHCKTSSPDNQTWTTANDIFIRAEDKVIAKIV